MKSRNRIWPVIFAGTLGVLVLLGLGAWQLQRLQWKEGIIRELAERQSLPPITLSEAIRLEFSGGDIEFRRVVDRVTYTSARELNILTTFEGRPGYEIVVSAVSAEGVPILVDRGVVPEELRDVSLRPASMGVTAEVSGILRRHAGKRGYFTPDNDASGNNWYWWDLPAMQSALGVSTPPFVLHLTPDNRIEGYPKPLPADTGLKNNHFQYAMTWLALAVVLAFMTALFARARLTGSGA